MSSDYLVQEEENKYRLRQHELDSLNLLMFILLLILVIFSIWFLKKKKITFLHESGLAIIYGTIFGAFVTFVLKNDSYKISLTFSVPNETFTTIDLLPTVVFLKYPNVSRFFVYAFKDTSADDDFKQTSGLADKATFNSEVFFNILLPPIIFHAGYSMKRRHFFRNFGAILVYALVGTTISTFCIGGLLFAFVQAIGSVKSYFAFKDCLLFGSIISATDPVTTLAIFSEQNLDSDLYALIFGESVLNDAVSIILSEQVEKFGNSQEAFDVGQLFKAFGSFLGIFLGSISIGAIIGCLNAMFTKFTKIKELANLETVIFLLISYSTFLAAEAVGLSGIVSLLICGIFQAHYTYNNLSEESQRQTREILHLMDFLSENFIFIYIGVSVFTFEKHRWEVSFISSSLVCILVARMCNIYPLSFLINLTRPRDKKIKFNMQHLMTFSGLRGALAFALAIRNTTSEVRQLILTTTLVIVIVTVIFCGGFTSKMAQLLKIKFAQDENEIHSPEIKKKLTEPTGKLAVFHWLRSFDKRFIKPLLTNVKPSLMETLPQRLLPIARIFTTSQQLEAENLSLDTATLIEESKSESNTSESGNSRAIEVDELVMNEI